MIISLLVISFSLNAKTLTTEIGVISRLYAYDDTGAIAGRDGADIAVWLKTGLVQCKDGVWLSPAVPGYKTITSFLLTAYTTKQNVRFQVYSDKIWKGSSTYKLCQIDAIRFE